jgi:hypothetical protein
MRAERGAALAGFAFIATAIGTAVTETTGPDITKTPAELTAKLMSDRADVLVNSAVNVAGGLAVLLLAATIATLIVERGARPVLARIVLGAGAVTAASKILGAVLSAADASSIHQLHDNQIVYLLFRAAQTADMAPMIFFAVLLVASIAGMLEVGLLSRASARAGTLIAGVLLLGGFDYLAPDAGPLSPVQALGAVLSLIYLVVLSTTLLRADQPTTRAHESLVAAT